MASRTANAAQLRMSSWRIASASAIELDVDGLAVRFTSPEREYFPELGAIKLDVARYYLAIGPGIVNALRERPCMMHRFPKGLAGDKVHQKRVPSGAPPWLETVRVRFPRYDRDADELCVTKLADVIWAVQMSIRDPARERGRQCLRTTCSWPSLTLVSTVAVCRQNRGSRRRSRNLVVSGIPTIHNWSSKILGSRGLSAEIRPIGSSPACPASRCRVTGRVRRGRDALSRRARRRLPSTPCPSCRPRRPRPVG